MVTLLFFVCILHVIGFVADLTFCTLYSSVSVFCVCNCQMMKKKYFVYMFVHTHARTHARTRVQKQPTIFVVSYCFVFREFCCFVLIENHLPRSTKATPNVDRDRRPFGSFVFVSIHRSLNRSEQRNCPQAPKQRVFRLHVYCMQIWSHSSGRKALQPSHTALGLPVLIFDVKMSQVSITVTGPDSS